MQFIQESQKQEFLVWKEGCVMSPKSLLDQQQYRNQKKMALSWEFQVLATTYTLQT